MSRAAARDLYDFCNMVDQNTISGKEDSADIKKGDTNEYIYS